MLIKVRHSDPEPRVLGGIAFASDMPRINLVFGAAIRKALTEQGKRPPYPGPLVREMFNRCLAILQRLVGEHGWGLGRALDHVSHYLRLDLKGVKWEVEQDRMCWMPEDD